MKLTTIENAAFAKAKKYKFSEGIQNGYAKWGDYDDLPLKLVDLALDEADENGLSKGSTWHSACIEGIVKAIVGEGLSLSDESVAEDLPTFTNSDIQETPNQLFDKIAWDWKVQRLFAVEVLWTAESAAGLTEPTIAKLNHIPAHWIRAKEKNYRGYIEGYFVSQHFGARNRPLKNPEKDERADYIPVFNPSIVAEDLENDRKAQMKQIFVWAMPSRKGNYYPKPDYNGGLIDVFTDNEYRKSRIATLSNSTLASGIFQIAGISSENEETFAREFDAKHRNYVGKGSPILLAKPEGDQHIIGPGISLEDVTKTDSNFDADIRNRILTSHNVVSSRVIGIKEDNQGFATEQIVEEFNTFLIFTVKPLQQRILSGLNTLATYWLGAGNEFIINPIVFSSSDAEEGDAEDITDQETDDDVLNTIENGN